MKNIDESLFQINNYRKIAYCEVELSYKKCWKRLTILEYHAKEKQKSHIKNINY